MLQSGEHLAGQVARLRSLDNQGDAVTITTITTGSGEFSFSGVNAGSYVVELVSNGAVVGTSAPVTLTSQSMTAGNVLDHGLGGSAAAVGPGSGGGSFWTSTLGHDHRCDDRGRRSRPRLSSPRMTPALEVMVSKGLSGGRPSVPRLSGSVTPVPVSGINNRQAIFYRYLTHENFTVRLADRLGIDARAVSDAGGGRAVAAGPKILAPKREFTSVRST